jgi:CRISPR-associated protein Csb2
VYAPMGFSHDDLAAMSRMRRLWQHGGRPGLLAILVGQGVPADFGGFKTRDEETPLLAISNSWCSTTPFVLPRYPKYDRRGNPKYNLEGLWIDNPEMQLRTELVRRGFPEPIEVVAHPDSGPKSWRSFARERRNGDGSHAGRDGYGFRIAFPQAVRGPIAIGYACHFGLGQFKALRM